MVEAIETLNNGSLLNSHQQSQSNTYFTFPNETECNDFEKSGFKIVDEQDYMAFILSQYM